MDLLPRLNELALKRGLHPMEKDMLPELGYVGHDDQGKPVFLFMYQTDSSLCFIENLISDPESDPHQRAIVIAKLFDHAASEAKQLGAKYLMARTENNNLIPKLIDKNFVQSSDKTRLFIRGL